MKQPDLKDYLLLSEHGCELYDTRTKDDGVYFFIRNIETKKLKVIFPLKNNGSYTPLAVAEICDFLDVPIHPYGESAIHALKKYRQLPAITPEIQAHIDSLKDKEKSEGE